MSPELGLFQNNNNKIDISNIDSDTSKEDLNKIFSSHNPQQQTLTKEDDPVTTLDALLDVPDTTDIEYQNHLKNLIFEFPQGVPDHLRGRTWCQLLGVSTTDYENEAFQQFMKEGLLDAPNQRVIRNDVERTRAHLAQFKTLETRNIMERMLTLYCKQKLITYKQGLNEVLAPFFILHSDENFPMDLIYACFSTFVPRYLPLFGDEEFTSLQCAFLLFKQLLLYHDPFLSLFLEYHSISPELYVTPWFLTVFASKTRLTHLMCLWDYYLAEGDRFYFSFIALALLLEHRHTIFKTEVSQLPETLTQLGINSFQDLHRVWDTAYLLKRRTPSSFYSRLSNFHGNRHPPSILSELESEICLHILAQEILRHCYGLCRPAHNGLPSLWKLFLLDIRPKHEFDAGRLPLAIHVDLSVSDWRKTVDKLAEAACSNAKLGLQCDAIKDEDEQQGSSPQYHVCIMGNIESQLNEINEVVRLLCQGRLLRWVSIALGGYKEAHRLALASGLELVDHQVNTCNLCLEQHRNSTMINNNTNHLDTTNYHSNGSPKHKSNSSKTSSCGSYTSSSVLFSRRSLVANGNTNLPDKKTLQHSSSNVDTPPDTTSISGFSFMGALRRVATKRRQVAASTEDSTAQNQENSGHKEPQDSETLPKVDDNSTTMSSISDTSLNVNTDNNVLIYQCSAISCKFFSGESQIGSARRFPSAAEQGPCSLLVFADRFALLRPNYDNPKNITEQEALLGLYNIANLSKITSKKAHPDILFFYFSYRPKSPEFSLHFTETDIAITCIAVITRVYREYRRCSVALKEFNKTTTVTNRPKSDDNN